MTDFSNQWRIHRNRQKFVVLRSNTDSGRLKHCWNKNTNLYGTISNEWSYKDLARRKILLTIKAKLVVWVVGPQERRQKKHERFWGVMLEEIAASAMDRKVIKWVGAQQNKILTNHQIGNIKDATKIYRPYHESWRFPRNRHTNLQNGSQTEKAIKDKLLEQDQITQRNKKLGQVLEAVGDEGVQPLTSQRLATTWRYEVTSWYGSLNM